VPSTSREADHGRYQCQSFTGILAKEAVHLTKKKQPIMFAQRQSYAFASVYFKYS
jgi:hypothetical protein